jgi:hypothetical protein
MLETISSFIRASSFDGGFFLNFDLDDKLAFVGLMLDAESSRIPASIMNAKGGD